MKELTEILAAWREAGAGSVLATVVRLEGSGYRRPGARLLVLGDGRTFGSISGGCIERDVIYRAGAVAASGQAVVVRYDAVSEEEAGPGASLGCGGTIDILIEPATANTVEPLARLWERRQHGVVATLIEKRNADARVGWRMAVDESGQARGDGPSGQSHLDFPALPVRRERAGVRVLEQVEPRGQIEAGPHPIPLPEYRERGQEAGLASATDAPWSAAILEECRAALELRQSRQLRVAVGEGWAEFFLEYIEPPLELAIFGAGPDAVPLAALGRSMGWRITVVDLRSAAASSGRSIDADALLRGGAGDLDKLDICGGGAAIVMNHNWNHDLASLRRLAKLPMKYLGVLGPRRRTEKMLSRLGAAAPARDSLHYPVGLDIGAETPQEVALAVVAEITALLRGGTGGPLRDKAGPIHSPLESAIACPAES